MWSKISTWIEQLSNPDGLDNAFGSIGKKVFKGCAIVVGCGCLTGIAAMVVVGALLMGFSERSCSNPAVVAGPAVPAQQIVVVVPTPTPSPTPVYSVKECYEEGFRNDPTLGIYCK